MVIRFKSRLPDALNRVIYTLQGLQVCAMLASEHTDVLYLARAGANRWIASVGMDRALGQRSLTVPTEQMIAW